MTEAQKGWAKHILKQSETMGVGRHLSLPFHPFRPISSRAKHRRGKHRSFVLIPFSKWGWCINLGSKQQAPREQYFILHHNKALSELNHILWKRLRSLHVITSNAAWHQIAPTCSEAGSYLPPLASPIPRVWVSQMNRIWLWFQESLAEFRALLTKKKFNFLWLRLISLGSTIPSN